MRSFRLFRPALMAALAAIPAAVHAQGSAPLATSAPDIEPDAIAALEKMGAYLRSLDAFQVRVATTREDVLTDGEKVQFSSVTDLLAQRPNRFRAEVDGDRHSRIFFYDGKTFTLYARRAGYYATVPAPANVGELIDHLDEKYGIEVPLVDLFRWGGPKASTKEITVASDIGPGVVEGVTCEHYAFRQPGMDWQVWIQNGSFPLPRKLIITTMTDEARPQFTAVYTWNLAPSFNDAAFTFDPPSDARRIVFAEDAASGAARK
jgi:hypothetical protein